MNFRERSVLSRHGLSGDPSWPKAKYECGDGGKGSSTNLSLPFKNMYKGFNFLPAFSPI